MAGPETRPNRETRAAERAEADARPEPGRAPTREEEEAAARNTPGPETAEHYEEMLERGATQKGEGRVP
jgi:hypothetical protein